MDRQAEATFFVATDGNDAWSGRFAGPNVGEREFGVELVRRCWESIVCAQGYGWDMPNIISGQEGDSVRQLGADYYQDMMLWSLAAALAGTDLAGPCQPCGLVARMSEAGKA